MAGDTEKDAMTDRELAKELRAKLNVTDNDAVMLQLYPYLSGLAASKLTEGENPPGRGFND